MLSTNRLHHCNEQSGVIELNEDQANQSSFPPNCPVYVLYDDESPPGIDAQGVVSGVVLLRNNATADTSKSVSNKMKSRSMSITFTECYRVSVKCKGSDGEFYSREDLVEHSQLRYRNGCPVYVDLNLKHTRNTLDGRQSSKNYFSNEKKSEDYVEDVEEVTKEGIVLGFCDMPTSGGKESKFWYCVQELDDGVKTRDDKQYIHHVFPEQLSYRHDCKDSSPRVKQDDEECPVIITEIKSSPSPTPTPASAPATITDTTRENSSQFIHNDSKSNIKNHEAPDKYSDSATVSDTVPQQIDFQTGRKDDMSVSLASTNSVFQTKKESLEKEYIQKLEKIQETHREKQSPEQKSLTTMTNEKKIEAKEIPKRMNASLPNKIRTPLSAYSCIEWDGDNGTIVNHKNTMRSGNLDKKKTENYQNNNHFSRCAQPTSFIDRPLKSGRAEIETEPRKKKNLQKIGDDKYLLTLPITRREFDDCLMGPKYENLSLIKNKTKCRSVRILSKEGSDSLIYITADNEKVAFNTASYFLQKLSATILYGRNRLRHVDLSSVYENHLTQNMNHNSSALSSSQAERTTIPTLNEKNSPTSKQTLGFNERPKNEVSPSHSPRTFCTSDPKHDRFKNKRNDCLSDVTSVSTYTKKSVNERSRDNHFKGKKRSIEEFDQPDDYRGKHVKNRRKEPENYICRMELGVHRKVAHDILIGKGGYIHKKIIKESNCKKMTLLGNRGYDTCIITIDGGDRAVYAENAVQAILKELEKSLSDESLDAITCSRSYKYCCIHKSFGHNTVDCRIYTDRLK